MARKLLIVGLLLLIPVLALLFRKPVEPERTEPLNVARALSGTALEGFATADRPRPFRFPEDHGPHAGFRTEWWYFTGTVRTDQGRTFGYQLTFFRIALTPRPVPRTSAWGTDHVFMAHFALTDVEGRKFHFAERFSRAAMGLAGARVKPVEVHLENWSARETGPDPFSMHLTARDGTVAVDLDLHSISPVILNGARGLSRKGGGAGNASYYYSIPRLTTTGTIGVEGRTYPVTGLSWLDREWSTSALEAGQAGWDWFALQFDDGRSLMLYRLRRDDGAPDPHSSGTLVAADGASRSLTLDEVALEPSGWWQSPASGTRYPAAWRLRLTREDMDLVIEPRLENQELRTSVQYWEGAVTVKSAKGNIPVGSGYVEMTGYGGISLKTGH